MIQIKKLKLDPMKRVIVISDIHGSLDLFQRLLEKVEYTPDDYLFLNGDLCEKGPDSLGTIRFARKLAEASNQVFVNKGNCDILFRYILNGVEGVRNYMVKQPNTVFNEMLREQGKTLEDFPDMETLTQFFREYYKEEFDWLESLPVAYETDDHIIIHAGIDNTNEWQETTEQQALSMKAFYSQEHRAPKPVIVGHWPVVNYRTNDICSNNPIIDLEKRIIAIDGGNQIKKEGQINALIIDKGEYSFQFVDELSEERVITKTHVDRTNNIGTVTYPNYELKIIEEGKYFTRCLNVNLDIEQEIKNEFLIEQEGKIYCKTDLSTTFLSVEKGETVWIVRTNCEGYALVKKSNGQVGWIPNACMS